jgi:Ca-activated chloride channel homolog
MQFESPQLLAVLFVLPVLILVLRSFWRWRSVAQAQWHRRTIEARRGSTYLWTLQSGLVLCAIGLLIIAWANPQYGHRLVQARRQSADLIIALDVSRSMLAEDIKPSRIALGRLFGQQLVQTLRSHRVGVVLFAGEVALMLPPGDDHTTANDILAQSDPSQLSVQGTDLPETIALAANFFDPESPSGKALILITDSESHFDKADEAAQKVFDERGIVTCTVGVGTAEGGTIPDPEAGGAPLRNKKGEVVVSRLSESVLQDIAQAGGGIAVHVRDGDAALQQIKTVVNGLYKRDTLVSNAEQRESWYQWLVLPALLMLWGAYVLDIRHRMNSTTT